jgi:hypothetical protein
VGEESYVGARSAHGSRDARHSHSATAWSYLRSTCRRGGEDIWTRRKKMRRMEWLSDSGPSRVKPGMQSVVVARVWEGICQS